MQAFESIARHFAEQGGTFRVPPSDFCTRLKKIRAYVFDWDGVFNDGSRHGIEGSTFTEPDAMGTNMLRFSHWLAHGSLPVVAVITGEKNHYAYQLTDRERFHALYFRIAHKTKALHHLAETFGIQAHEVAFVFDDILDFGMAAACGLRIQVRRSANPLLNDFVVQHQLAEYSTFSPSGHFAVREATELLMGAQGNFDEAIAQRAAYSSVYQQYLADRKNVHPLLFTAVQQEITPVDRFLEQG